MSFTPGGERSQRHPDPMTGRRVGISDNAAVSLDDGPAFICFDGGQRWNGAVVPRFSRITAQRVIDWIVGEQSQQPAPEDMSFAWDGDVILMTEGAYAYEPGYAPARIEPDATGRYQLVPGWTWTLADAEVHIVCLRDQRAEDAWFAEASPRQPVVRSVAIGADCPVCAGPRGLPHRVFREEDGMSFAVDVWTNPCGHRDDLLDVLTEAGLR